MTIDEALEILRVRTAGKPLIGKHEVYGAIQLGIEALKVVKGYREIQPVSYPKLLPGETEE